MHLLNCINRQNTSNYLIVRMINNYEFVDTNLHFYDNYCYGERGKKYW